MNASSDDDEQIEPQDKTSPKAARRSPGDRASEEEDEDDKSHEKADAEAVWEEEGEKEEE